MKKTPTQTNANGVYGEQILFQPTTEFYRLMTPRGSAEVQVSNDLLVCGLTQLEWLASGYGKRS